MPTILRVLGFRFFFYSLEAGEPPHVHVAQDARTAKYWLDSVELASSDGFRAHELGRIRDLVLLNQDDFRRNWHEFHGS